MKMTDQHEKLNRLLAHANVSKIVYSLVMPETESVIDSVFDGSNAAEQKGRALFHDMFREAWTQKQDVAHEAFFRTWKRWSSTIVRFDATEFGYTYPNCGASEAIREAIYAYGARAAGRRDLLGTSFRILTLFRHAITVSFQRRIVVDAAGV